MLWRPVTGSLLVLGLLCAGPLEGAVAQPAQSGGQGSEVLGQIKQAASDIVLKSCDGVEVDATKVQIAVTLVNCSDKSSHGRNAEASWIADAIAKAIAGKDDYRAVVALHVDYVVREKIGQRQRRVDGIDFFKNAQGKFQLHIT